MFVEDTQVKPLNQTFEFQEDKDIQATPLLHRDNKETLKRPSKMQMMCPAIVQCLLKILLRKKLKV